MEQKATLIKKRAMDNPRPDKNFSPSEEFCFLPNKYIAKTFEEEADYIDTQYKNGRTAPTVDGGRPLALGNTPFLLSELGFGYGRIEMLPQVVGKATGQEDRRVTNQHIHHVSLSVLQRLPYWLWDPVAIIAWTSEKAPLRLMIVSNYLVKNQPVIAILEMEQTSDFGKHCFVTMFEHNMAIGNNNSIFHKWAQEKKFLYTKKRDWSELSFTSIDGRQGREWYPSTWLLLDVPTRDDLLARYESRQERRYFLLGLDLEDPASEEMYDREEIKMLRLGYPVINPIDLRKGEDPGPYTHLGLVAPPGIILTQENINTASQTTGRPAMPTYAILPSLRDLKKERTVIGKDPEQKKENEHPHSLPPQREKEIPAGGNQEKTKPVDPQKEPPRTLDDDFGLER
ncbi:hypothetical protein [Parasphaerochaeta coccoides]|uniref:Phage MuF C-terminal domain-containing protein n=1 Tax=Parasphaerochaeta coccoides (strain ATCC BAA-1237 / DSM 17374 / SPN1) TaxID=760011 RepID=F4GJU5_PARC1|nr:hypothetical protein [Parasphaerochaeta coccoides]AEC01370.1 hypothetical protein Spico_0130 [Parasphaerochaeta coccoides DSM 17374]